MVREGNAKHFFGGFFAAFVVMILFMSSPAFAAYARDFSDYGGIKENSTNGSDISNSFLAEKASLASDTNVPITDTNTPGSSNIEGIDYSNGKACVMSSLTPKESKAIMNITSDGFNGKKIGDGQDVNEPGKKLDDLMLIGESSDGKNAVSNKPHNEMTPADRFNFFSNHIIKGPWGIGFVLDDTLRVGRCKDLKTADCKIYGEGLMYRTSGVGFTSYFKSAGESILDPVEKIKANLSSEDQTKIMSNIDDVNADGFTVGKVLASNQIKNSIATESYAAKSATSCTNSNCTISTYSRFDKYYNAWFSTDLVVFNIGPTLVSQAGKLMKAVGIRTFPELQGKTIFSKLNNLYSKTVSGIKETPAQLVGIEKMSQYYPNVQRDGFGKILEDLTINKKLFSNGAGGFVSEAMQDGSPIMKLTATQKEKLFDDLQPLYSYVKTSNVSATEWRKTLDVLNAAHMANPADAMLKKQYEDAVVDVGRRLADMGNAWDDYVRLDVPEWTQERASLFGFEGVSLRKNGSLPDQGFISVADSESFNMKEITKQFGYKDGTGNWASWYKNPSSATFEATQDGALQLYKISPEKVLKENVPLTDLERWVKTQGANQTAIRLNDGTLYPLTEDSLKTLATNPQLPPSITVYGAGYVPAQKLTPEQFANSIAQGRMMKRYNAAENNMKELMNAMAEKNFKPRRSASWLDKQFAAQENMLTEYFTQPLTGGLYKGTLLPIVYWNAKRGFGYEDISAYMLPDTWTKMDIVQGVDKIYRDSFIDFFANEGSDQGDMFAKVINWLPWKSMAVDKLAANNKTTSQIVSSISGEGGLGASLFGKNAIMRDSVKDLAFFSHNENCVDCVSNMQSEGDYLMFGGFRAPEKLQAFLVEAVDSEQKSKDGSTIVAYTHHSNIKGQSGDIEGGQINLVDGRTKSETCDQKLREIGIGWANLGMFGTASGGVLAGAENLAYFIHPGAGLLMSGIQQLALAPKLKDCVDDAEGYYIHFYMPPTEKYVAGKTKELISNETLTDTVSKFAENINDAVSKKSTDAASGGNLVSQAMDKLKNQFANFSEQAKKANLLQASMLLAPPNKGSLLGKDVFYIWYKDFTMAAGYPTEGKLVYTDGNNAVGIDNKTGEITYNGKVIVPSTKADNVRLATNPPDARIPGIVVPKTVTRVGAPETDAIVFEININGEVKVTYADVLSCIQKAVEEQVGIPFSGDELTQVFGKLESLKTADYSGIFIENGQISLEGLAPRQAAQGSDSKILIDGFWQTKLSTNGQLSQIGKFVSMNFEHGVIVLKPETNELIVWLRQHKDSVLDSKDVAGLTATKTSVIDPETQCPVPAIDFKALAYPNDDLGQMKVSNFNLSMDKLGPFTQFTTDKYIYEFYSKVDPVSGECKDYFRRRDKATGKILEDSEIVGGVDGIKQLDDGTLVFDTVDGKSHTLKFDAENGVPKLTYNNGTPETLLSAQGTNGSFWYDPNTGKWYPENGNIIPLNQGFKDNGVYFSGTDGKITGEGKNPMTFNVGSSTGSGMNIPSVPGTAAGLIIFVSVFLLVSFIFTRKAGAGRRTKKYRKV